MSKKKVQGKVKPEEFIHYILFNTEHPAETPKAEDSEILLSELEAGQDAEFFDKTKIAELKEAIKPKIEHTPKAAHLASASFTARKHYMPIADVQIASDRLYVNDDGTPAEIVEFNCICRLEQAISGNIKKVYYTPDRYKILNWTKYKNQTKRLLKHWAESRQGEAKTKAFFNGAESGAGVFAEQALGSSHVEAVNKYAVKDLPSNTERLDRQIDKLAETNDPFALDDAFPDVGMNLPDNASPAQMARYMNLIGGKYKKEYILRTVHRLLLRGMPVHYIAMQFNVHPNTVNKWIAELKSRLKMEATQVNLYDIAGDSIAFYNEVRSMGMAIATTAQKVPEKVRGLEAALSSENSKHRFLAGAGMYDIQRLGREIGHDPNTKKATQIIDMARDILSGNFTFVEEEEKPEDQLGDNERVFF